MLLIGSVLEDFPRVEDLVQVKCEVSFSVKSSKPGRWSSKFDIDGCNSPSMVGFGAGQLCETYRAASRHSNTHFDETACISA